MSSPSRSPSWRGGPPGKSGCPETCRKPSLQWENSRRARARDGRRCRLASWSRCSHGSTARLARSSFSAPARNTTGCSAPGHCLSDSPGSPEPVDGSISHYETGACLWAPPTTWGQETRVDVAGVDALGQRSQRRMAPSLCCSRCTVFRYSGSSLGFDLGARAEDETTLRFSKTQLHSTCDDVRHAACV